MVDVVDVAGFGIRVAGTVRLVAADIVVVVGVVDAIDEDDDNGVSFADVAVADVAGAGAVAVDVAFGITVSVIVVVAVVADVVVAAEEVRRGHYDGKDSGR